MQLIGGDGASPAGQSTAMSVQPAAPDGGAMVRVVTIVVSVSCAQAMPLMRQQARNCRIRIMARLSTKAETSLTQQQDRGYGRGQPIVTSTTDGLCARAHSVSRGGGCRR